MIRFYEFVRSDAPVHEGVDKKKKEIKKETIEANRYSLRNVAVFYFPIET